MARRAVARAVARAAERCMVVSLGAKSGRTLLRSYTPEIARTLDPYSRRASPVLGTSSDFAVIMPAVILHL
jgi:hypothetical protein